MNRGGKQIAIQAAKKLFSSSKISIATITPDIFSETYALFVHHADQEWSFTDCSSMIFLDKHYPNRSVSVVTFDWHFAAAGFQTAPIL